MPITPFGWKDHGPPDLDAVNLEGANSHAGAYTDALEAAIAAGTAALPSSVVSSSAAFAEGQIETNARAFGVKGEGEAHDDYAAMQQAIEHAQNTGTPLVLPGGTASEPVVIYLGAGGKAYGGLKIAAGKPLTIRGPGKGCCYFLLSRSCPRLFDFDPLGLQNQTFSGIEMSGFTVDAGNVTYEVLAPPTEVTETKVIPGGSVLTKIKLTSNANFQGATAGIWFVTQERSMFAKPVEGSTTEIEVRNGGEEFTVTAGQKVTGAFIQEDVIGNRHSAAFQQEKGSATLLVTNFKNIYFHDIDIINLPATQVSGLVAESPSRRLAIYIGPGGVGSLTEDITCERVKIYGGDTGFSVGDGAGTWTDRIRFKECLHDRMATPTANYSSSNFIVGGNGWIGRVDIERCTGRNSGDVGVEIDNAMIANIDEATFIEDNWSAAYYATNFVPPALSIAGPPTATLSAEITAAATTATVAAVPSSVDGEGYAQIGTELVHYIVKSAAELTIIREINGSTKAIHANGATVTFLLHRRQRYKFKGQSRRVLSESGRGFAMFTNHFLPLPAVFLEGGHERVNNNGHLGEAVNIEGLPGAFEIGDNYRCMLAGNCTEPVNFIYIQRLGNVTGFNPLGYVVLPDKVAIGRAVFQASGIYSGSATMIFFQLESGVWDWDFGGTEVINDVSGIVAKTKIFFAGANNTCNLLMGVDLKVRSREGSDSSPQIINAAGTHVSLYRLDVRNLDLRDMVTSWTAKETKNYQPIIVPSGAENALTIHNIIHPYAIGSQAYGARYPKRPKKWGANITASPAEPLTHDIEVQPVATASASATVVIELPLINAAKESGSITANPPPGTGGDILVLDTGNAAATHNIEVKAQAPDKLGGVEGGTLVLKTNGVYQRFVGHAILGWWPVQ